MLNEFILSSISSGIEVFEIDNIREYLLSYFIEYDIKYNNNFINSGLNSILLEIINLQKFIIISKNPLVFKSNISKNENMFLKEEKIVIIERNLHEPLSLYLNSLDIKNKTIYHEKCKKQKSLNWQLPDIVGFKGLNFQKGIYYSFEIKRYLNINNFRNYYFQAISNSMWANLGYLVFYKYDFVDFDLIEEINHLSDKFGVGVIQLDIEFPLKSNILVNARFKPSDKKHLNKLIDFSPDFQDLIKNGVI